VIFTIELKSIEGFMEDLLKRLINPLVKYRQNQHIDTLVRYSILVYKRTDIHVCYIFPEAYLSDANGY